MNFKFKTLPVMLMLALSATVARSDPPSSPDDVPFAIPAAVSHSDDKSLTERSLTVMGNAANRIGTAIDTGVHAFGSGVHVFGSSVQRVTSQATFLLQNAVGAIGVPYRRGGTSAETGFDCSGFVRAMVQQTVGKLLPHRAAEQAAVTQKINKDELAPGDLVFFNTVRRHAYSHVGIYMGDGKFIHAPSQGEHVRIDSLSQAYWQKRFEGARRVLIGDDGGDVFSLSSKFTLADTSSTFIVPATALSFLILPGMTPADAVTDTPVFDVTSTDSVPAETSAADVHLDLADATTSATVLAVTDTAATLAPMVVVSETTPVPESAAAVSPRKPRHASHVHAAIRRGHDGRAGKHSSKHGKKLPPGAKKSDAKPLQKHQKSQKNP